MLALLVESEGIGQAAEGKVVEGAGGDTASQGHRVHVDDVDPVGVDAGNIEGRTIRGEHHVRRMQAGFDMNHRFSRGSDQVDDRHRAGGGDSPFIDDHLGAGGIGGEILRLRPASSPVGDVGGSFIGGQDHIVRCHADGDFSGSLAGGEVDHGEGVVPRLANVCSVSIVTDGDAGGVRVPLPIGSWQGDDSRPAESSVAGDGRLVQVRLSIGRPQACTTAIDGDSMHRSAAVGKAQFLQWCLHRTREYDDSAMILDVDEVTGGVSDQVHRSTGELDRLPRRPDQLTGGNPVTVSSGADQGRVGGLATGWKDQEQWKKR